MTIKLDPQKGLSVPSLTTTERNNIVSPEDGALVFDVDLNQLFAYENNSWNPLGGTQPTSDWEAGTSTTESLVSPAKVRNSIPPALNATGSAPIYAFRAWVNFDGTGTVSIRDSGNVSSVTDNGTGDYTVNFATAMPDTNYSCGVNGGNEGNRISRTPFVDNKQTLSFDVHTTIISNGNQTDVGICDIQVIR